jgi:hypothetical protein
VLFATSNPVSTFLCEQAEAFGFTEHLVLIGALLLSLE